MSAPAFAGCHNKVESALDFSESPLQHLPLFQTKAIQFQLSSFGA